MFGFTTPCYNVMTRLIALVLITFVVNRIASRFVSPWQRNARAFLLVYNKIQYGVLRIQYTDAKLAALHEGTTSFILAHHILLFRTGPSSLALALSSCFLILPVAVFGSGPNTTDLGTQ